MKTRFQIKVMVALLVVAAASSTSLAQDKVAELLKKGDAAYRKAYSNKQTWAAMYYYKEAVKLNPKSYEAQWRVARTFFWLTDNTDNKGKDKDLGWQGYAAALQAIRLNSKGVEGHYFAALCIGEYSKGLGIVTALRKGIESKFKNHLNMSMKIKRCYDYGGADRAYGNLFHLLPWPKRDRKKAMKHYRWSLKCRKAVPRTHYYMARVLAADDKNDEAKKEIENCLKARRGTATDNYRSHKLCKKLLKKISK